MFHVVCFIFKGGRGICVVVSFQTEILLTSSVVAHIKWATDWHFKSAAVWSLHRPEVAWRAILKSTVSLILGRISKIFRVSSRQNWVKTVGSEASSCLLRSLRASSSVALSYCLPQEQSVFPPPVSCSRNTPCSHHTLVPWLLQLVLISTKRAFSSLAAWTLPYRATAPLPSTQSLLSEGWFYCVQQAGPKLGSGNKVWVEVLVFKPKGS